MSLIPCQSKPEVQFDLSKRIFIKEDVLAPDLCDKLISYGNTNVTRGVSKYPGLFDISFYSCLLPLDSEAHSSLQESWSQVVDHFKFDIDFVEPYELKRYTSADFFGKHVDNYYSLTKDIDRKITMSVQLSDSTEYAGGDLVVTGQYVRAKKGSVVCFPSYFPHWVDKLSSGTRWSLIGWAWGPYWK